MNFTKNNDFLQGNNKNSLYAKYDSINHKFWEKLISTLKKCISFSIKIFLYFNQFRLLISPFVSFEISERLAVLNLTKVYFVNNYFKSYYYKNFMVERAYFFSE